MTLKKSYLETLALALKGTEGVLNLADSRVRDAFLKKLKEYLETFYTDRVKIYEKFCDKKEDGTPDIDDGQYHFSKEVQEELTKELLTLLEEEVELPGNIKAILEKTEYKPKQGEVEIIDTIISLCEN